MNGAYKTKGKRNYTLLDKGLFPSLVNNPETIMHVHNTEELSI